MEDVNNIWVEIGNGQELQCQHRCRNVEWEMPKQTFAIDVYMLPLGNYDMILGIQWLH